MTGLVAMEHELDKPPASQLIRAARKERGWTQEQLAEMVGTRRTHLIRWEMGRGYPGDTYRPRLAAILDLDPDDLRRPEPSAEELRSLEQRVAELEKTLEMLRERFRVFP